ncbi:MAG TPA: hypothetical protein VEF72_15925 [Mycobacterium sp.]|nr:hypothetical protein [Mycobacterium sp.]
MSARRVTRAGLPGSSAGRSTARIVAGRAGLPGSSAGRSTARIVAV